MNIEIGESGSLEMNHDYSIKKDITIFSNPIKKFLNLKYSKEKKKQPFKYKVLFERIENKIILDYASADIECTANDFIDFSKKLKILFLNSNIEEIIIPQVVNNVLARYLKMKGFYEYKKGIKNELYDVIYGEKEYVVFPGYKKIINRS